MEFRYKTRVEFYDVDSMDVVWHGNYIKYFEAARCAFLREIGYDYANFRDDGFALPVVKLDIKYIKPQNTNELAILNTHLGNIKKN